MGWHDIIYLIKWYCIYYVFDKKLYYNLSVFNKILYDFVMIKYNMCYYDNVMMIIVIVR
jgi:hypothetical protein